MRAKNKDLIVKNPYKEEGMVDYFVVPKDLGDQGFGNRIKNLVGFGSNLEIHKIFPNKVKEFLEQCGRETELHMKRKVTGDWERTYFHPGSGKEVKEKPNWESVDSRLEVVLEKGDVERAMKEYGVPEEALVTLKDIPPDPLVPEGKVFVEYFSPSGEHMFLAQIGADSYVLAREV